ncbi:mitochondrial potassium channel ATP-binding subunit-like [Paramacrobiotus metropolitanus]|uniref:mitochondrial potassium channel ATP-binding subunit-like n=1 Tax=Paramacrobiotus metropolitanus TaxID=2943436 RepID=UPI00244649E0|nr:mitochondrial potassium channel ATP-binding subunit-like [Paramacrobiotus metropolitanus]
MFHSFPVHIHFHRPFNHGALIIRVNSLRIFFPRCATRIHTLSAGTQRAYTVGGLWRSIRRVIVRNGDIRTAPSARFLEISAGIPVLFLLRAKQAVCQNLKARTKNRVQAFKDARQQITKHAEPEFDWKMFFRFLQPDLLILLGAIVCSVCLALINTEIPLLLGKLVNVVAQVVPNKQTDYFSLVKDPVTKLCLIYFLHAGLTFVNISLLAAAGERLAARLRLALFAGLIKQDIAFFDAHKTGELVSRLAIDVQDFKSNFKHCFVNGFRTLVQTIGCGISLYWISPNMTLMLMLGLPSMAGIGALLASKLRQLSRKAQAQVAHATDVADEAISNIRTVRSFAAEDTEMHLYHDEVKRSQYLNQYLGMGIGLFQGLSNLAFNAAVLGVIYFGGNLMAENKMQAGDLMSFLVTSQTIQKSLATFSMLFGQAVAGMAAGARVFEFIKLEPLMEHQGGKRIPYHSLDGTVSFHGVSFAYPTRPDHPVLKSLNLRIPAGKVVALCGPSGSGKSTVAALLERFYDPVYGKITLDETDIRLLDPSWLRGRVIGYISQEPTLFATSIIENIRYGRPDATDAEVYEASKAANADGFITKFPKGYQTILGERGVTVSGGQKQRIAIARALLKNPSILILDEATSALDSESEKLVQEALDRAVKGRTVLVIAHRLSTIQNADAIALIVNGQIAELGDHRSLMKKKGLYWQFVQHQSTSETGDNSDRNNG